MITKSVWDGVEAVVFDAVGTLIEPRPSVTEVYLAAASRQGVELARDDVRRRFHRHFRHDELDEVRGPLVTDEAIEFRRWRRIVGSVLPEVSDPGRAFTELWEHFARAESWRCFADVGPAIAKLQRRGLPVRIASNFDARLNAVVSGIPEISGLSQLLVVSSEVGYRKPHPAFYQAACQSLGMDPGKVLFVGDDEENDVNGPRRAGLKGVRVERSGRFNSMGDGVADLTSLVNFLDD